MYYTVSSITCSYSAAYFCLAVLTGALALTLFPDPNALSVFQHNLKIVCPGLCESRHGSIYTPVSKMFSSLEFLQKISLMAVVQYFNLKITKYSSKGNLGGFGTLSISFISTVLPQKNEPYLSKIFHIKIICCMCKSVSCISL